VSDVFCQLIHCRLQVIQPIPDIAAYREVGCAYYFHPWMGPRKALFIMAKGSILQPRSNFTIYKYKETNNVLKTPNV
jgi:hypothetical protein